MSDLELLEEEEEVEVVDELEGNGPGLFEPKGCSLSTATGASCFCFLFPFFFVGFAARFALRFGSQTAASAASSGHEPL